MNKKIVLDSGKGYILCDVNYRRADCFASDDRRIATVYWRKHSDKAIENCKTVLGVYLNGLVSDDIQTIFDALMKCPDSEEPPSPRGEV